MKLTLKIALKIWFVEANTIFHGMLHFSVFQYYIDPLVNNFLKCGPLTKNEEHLFLPTSILYMIIPLISILEESLVISMQKVPGFQV